MFKCQECGRKFRSVAAAERAVDRGCPRCGGCDIDLDTPDDYLLEAEASARFPEPMKDSLHDQGL